jgi:hypothetical protein
MNPLSDTLNIGNTAPRQDESAARIGDTLNVGATLPAQVRNNGAATQAPALDELDNQHTIRMPGSGSLVFNRYRLQRVLGRGGMGVVWLGVDTKLERAVALKFLPDVIGADPAALRELKDETRRGLELAHPNIVRIYDFVDDDEAAAISMEFVDGKSLSEQRLAKPHRVFTVDDISQWVGQMCDALDYAHLQKRIVHRDLKPANLMVNSESEIKITDFGIARSVSDTMSRVSRAQHGTSGTLLYMSPQQAMGDRPHPTDDIYALGATLYELLTGKPPFYSGDVSMQITTKTAPSLKARRDELETGATDDIPKVWEDAIASCLEKEPAKRPQTAGEFARRLGLGLRCETQAAPVKTKAGGLKQIEMTSKTEALPRKKSPMVAVLLASAATLLLLAGTGIGGVWWWTHRPGSWAVQTEPAGAQITLDGHTLIAPATLSDLKPGAYRASVAMDGYEPAHVEFNLAAGQRADAGLVKLQRSTGSLMLTSEPAGANYEVKSAADDKGQKFTGVTPDTIQLPIGKYSVTMKRDGESKLGDQEILRNVKSLQTFAFAKPPPPEPPAPAVAATPPEAPAPVAPTSVAAATTDSPPAASVNPPSPADTPPAPTPIVAANAGSSGSAQPSQQTIAAAALASQPPSAGASPVISAPAGDSAPGPNIAAVIAAQAQSAVNPPEAGYWKLSEIFANSEYSGYSESGRGYIVYKAQQALDESADGVPGKGTYKAIQKFQTEHGLAATGQLDSATLAAMELNGQPDKSDWGGGGSRRSSHESSDDKTAARKFIERNLLGGRDLKNIFRR